MLGFFTDPYPDEILYSAIARYHELVRNRGTSTTLSDLYGISSIKVSIDLPSRLGTLLSNLPPNHGYTVDRLIDQHTMLPFYTPFLPPVRAARLREDMAGDRAQSIYGRLGATTRGAPVESLRYCPICFEDDQNKYGEPYWHRVHQAPGILACPTHAVFLENSSVVLQRRSYKNALVSARRAVSVAATARRLDLDVHQDQVHLRLARNAAWLLNQQSLSLEHLRERYKRVLYEKSLASRTGVIHQSELRRRLEEFYTPGLLESLSCEIKVSQDWLVLTVRKTPRAQHVLCHLLLINFLGYSAEELFRLPETREPPFGSPPYPCLNHVSEHFRETRINACDVDVKVAPDGSLRATFACLDCGFVYRRYVHDDEAGEVRFSFDRVLRFGDVWDDALRRYVAENELNKGQIAERLGVSREVLNTRIERVGLDNGHVKRLPPLGRRGDSPAVRNAKRTKYRAMWLRAMDKHPDEGRRALAARVRAAYGWLIRNDMQWYLANAPSRRQPKGGKVKCDREQRDAELAVQVRVSIDQIKSLPGRPVRASKTAVMRELKGLLLMTKYPEQIPRTIEVLESHAESAEQFAVRRVWWATRCLLEEKVRGSKSELIKRSVITRMVSIPAVKTALDEAVECLARACEQGWE